MDDTTSTSTSAPLSPVATNSSNNPSTPESKKKKRGKDSENATKQRLFASSWDISNVLLDEGQKVIVSIKGVHASLILLTHLKEFAKNLAIRGCSSMSKSDLVLAIIQKHLMKDAYVGIRNGTLGTEEKRNKPKKDARPTTLQRDGSLFRIINVIMSDEGKKHYFQAQQPYDRNALDSHHAYLEEYKALHSIYSSNDASLDSIAKSLYPSFNEHFGDVYDDDQAIAYDQLTVEELERGINFVNRMYREKRNKNERSGQHEDFHMYIGTHGWLLYYHERMESVGDTDFSNIAYAELDDSIAMTSSGGRTLSNAQKKRKNGYAKNDKESNQKLKEKQAVLLDKRIFALDSNEESVEAKIARDKAMTDVFVIMAREKKDERLHKLYAMVDSNSVRPNIKKAYRREIAGLEKELGYDEDNDEDLEKELGHDEGRLHDIDSDSSSD